MMEEVYVIKLKGVPSTTTSETSTTYDGQDLMRMSTLGLGVLHIIFGVLVLTFGALRSTADNEPNVTIFGILFGPIFFATGLAAVLTFRKPYRKVKMKVLFGLSTFSAIGSTTFVSLCLVGVVYFHSVPRAVGDNARITANAIVAAVGELVVSLLTLLTAGSAIWQFFQCGVFRPHFPQKPLKQKVIVKTNIVGSSPDGFLDSEVIRHVSPNCIISLRATDEQKEAAKRVEEYVRDLHSQDDLSFTFSDFSTTVDEKELGVDSQNWRNEVLAVANLLSLRNDDETDRNQNRHTVDSPYHTQTTHSQH